MIKKIPGPRTKDMVEEALKEIAWQNARFWHKNPERAKYLRPTGLEPIYSASEADALSIELRAPI